MQPLPTARGRSPARREPARPRPPDLHAARLEDLGRLVPGLVHELGNPAAVLQANLGAVVDHVDTLGQLLRGLDRGGDPAALRADLELDDLTADLAEVVGESATALDDLVSLLAEIRRYAAGAGPETEADPARAVAAALRLARYETKYRATLSVEVGDLPRAAIAEVQLTQVVLALVLNAVEAEGTVPRELGHLGHLSVRAAAVGDEVRLEVRDDGPGVSPDAAGALFDAGFSTREGRRGLGLTHARQLARGAGGDITFENPSGGGARFLVRLPAVPDDASDEAIGPVHKT